MSLAGSPWPGPKWRCRSPWASPHGTVSGPLSNVSVTSERLMEDTESVVGHIVGRCCVSVREWALWCYYFPVVRGTSGDF